ncbi:hypothetical protein ScPMuIL_010090 [Solemya velum]
MKKPIAPEFSRPRNPSVVIKTETLRAEQPQLDKMQTSSFRNSYKHNLCLDMLQQGYHKSFSELFALIKQQEEDRQRAGPESLMWSMTMLKEEYEKLDMLKIHLTRAEDAYRKGLYDEVYKSRYELAKFFQMTSDKWLADHFFHTCLQTSSEVKEDGGRMHAESFCNVALAQEENGDCHEAAANYEAYYRLTSNNSTWTKEDGLNFHTDACINLCRINTILGQNAQTEDPQVALNFLIKANEMAKESLELRMEGEAAYRLGLAYDRTGDHQTALLHLNNYLETCKQIEDSDGLGKAFDAIAKAYASQGEVQEAIEYLKQYVEVAERSGQETAYSQACHNLGSMFNSLGRYEEATEYFSKAYNLSRTLSDFQAINTNRVQFGIAMAHKTLRGFGDHVVLGSRQAVERVVEWKCSRTEEFDKPFPEPVVEEPKVVEEDPVPYVLPDEDTQETQEPEQAEDGVRGETTLTTTENMTETTDS